MNLTSTSTGTRRFRDARDRGCVFLLDRLRPDGGFGDPKRGLAEYYKVPAAVAVCGETAAANRLCNWIRKHGMLANGDFGPRPESIRGYGYTYYNTWVIKGAHRLRLVCALHRQDRDRQGGRPLDEATHGGTAELSPTIAWGLRQEKGFTH